MTRFARAKGSKSSNERVPEEATSWEVMKQQMEQKKQESFDAKKFKEMEAVRKANYQSFLNERDNDIENKWAEFEDVTGKQPKDKSTKNNKVKSKGIKEDNDFDNPELQNDDDDDDDDPELQDLISKIEDVLDNGGKTGKSKKKKLEKKEEQVVKEDDSEDDDAPEEVSAKITPTVSKTKLKLPKKMPLKIPSITRPNEDVTNTKEGDNNTSTNDKKKGKKRKINEDISDKKVKKPKKSVEEPNNNLEKKNKKNKKIDNRSNSNDAKSEKKKQTKIQKQEMPPENLSEDQLKRINKKKEKRMRQLERKKQHKAEQREKLLLEQQNQNVQKRQLPKERDNKEHQKRKPNSEIRRMNINGIEVDIDYYDGFPIKKEDAERLRKLRKEMISKGIPRSEVQRAMKLERRKAEKALAREKKKVCFNCRKSGHVLSECPDLNENCNQEIIGAGVCFKCGSTEHTHFECKVVKKDDFKFATCFICREQGHISRQCPDNQKGLYPKGGACRVCGDVTHLKKDCPKYQTKQESQIVKLDTLEINNVESLPEDQGKSNAVHKNKKAKIVKF